MFSCKKTLDINTDPNNPTSLEVSKLLPTAEVNLGNALAVGSGSVGGLSTTLEVYVHRMTTREDPDQYKADGNEFYLNTAWPSMYQSVIKNLDIIVENATAAGNLRYVGIAKILRAYAYSQFVDVFGDIPFSEAGKLRGGNKAPKFDDDATIYPQLIAMIDDGIANLNNPAPGTVVPGTDDVIYGGNKDRWIKAANTIKLKLYTQMRKVKNVSVEVTALLGQPLINATTESFLLPYGPLGSTDDRHPGFGEYFSTQRGNHVSPWFYEILKGYNPRLFTGIVDPRIPYYFYNQLKPNQAPKEGNQTEYRDGAFASIYFGSVGPDRDRSQQNTLSVFGIYPVGGRYDQGDGLSVTASSGTGAAPQRFITYADRLYLEAELINAGVIAGDAKARLKSAIEESFRTVDLVVTTYVKPAQTVPALYNTAAMTNYVNAVLAQYDAGDNTRKLEIIMTEKWIQSFGNGVDAYTDYRRTGFPVLFNPNDATMAPGGKVQPPINGDPVNPGAQKAVPVQLSKAYPLSLPWPSTELELNPNAPKQKQESTFKIFWMP